jgi:hypothetical protein
MREDAGEIRGEIRSVGDLLKFVAGALLLAGILGAMFIVAWKAIDYLRAMW